MSYLQSVLFSQEVSSDDDDIDSLFSQLEQIEPPSSLIDSILASVAQLAQQQHSVSNDFRAQIGELIVPNEDPQAS